MSKNKNPEEVNLKYWNEIAPVHLKSYRIDELRQGGILLDKIQQKELGDIRGKSLLHLQCHIGTDSISLERVGAVVTGVDFSEESIEIARSLCKEFNANVRYITSNIFDLEGNFDEQFDIVYTSKGVLSWNRDVNKWAKIIYRFLKPGGFFYILEIHPVLHMFDDSENGEVEIRYPYFNQPEPSYFDDEFPDYSDKSFLNKNPTYEWTWSLSDILNALIQAGLKIEFVHEYDKLFYQGLSCMERDADNWWHIPKYKGMVPLSFSLKAYKY